MPEAAEVEQVRRGLEFLEGQTLEELWTVEKLGAHGFEDEVVGEKLLAVSRQGKLLGFQFGEAVLTSHLRMTGRWLVGEKQDKSTRAILYFSEDTVTFQDPRGFGTMDVRDAERWDDGLGPDLLSLDEEWLPAEQVQRSKRATKAVLLDQSVVAGVGNYLADETLWQNKIDPRQPAMENSEKKWRGLYKGAKDLALRTLESGGVSLRDYVGVDGQEGQGEDLLQVYGRAGDTCLRCGFTLQKIKVAGRGTTFCPTCQSA